MPCDEQNANSAIETYLQTHPSVNRIVVFDDAGFSGQQLTSHIGRDLYHALSVERQMIVTMVTPFLTENAYALACDPEHIEETLADIHWQHSDRPYDGFDDSERLQDAQLAFYREFIGQRSLSPVEISSHTKIKIMSEYHDPALLQIMEEMWCGEWNKHCLGNLAQWYTDLKVPDDASVVNVLRSGEVWNTNRTAVHLPIIFIPMTCPVYRNNCKQDPDW
jgi:hypothetical protein